jgi:hypothetical protein
LDWAYNTASHVKQKEYRKEKNFCRKFSRGELRAQLANFEKKIVSWTVWAYPAHGCFSTEGTGKKIYRRKSMKINRVLGLPAGIFCSMLGASLVRGNHPLLNHLGLKFKERFFAETWQ